MVQRVSTVSFEGIEVRPVDVQVQVAPGMPAFTIVGSKRHDDNLAQNRRALKVPAAHGHFTMGSNSA